jgi:hypothetical protein
MWAAIDKCFLFAKDRVTPLFFMKTEHFPSNGQLPPNATEQQRQQLHAMEEMTAALRPLWQEIRTQPRPTRPYYGTAAYYKVMFHAISIIETFGNTVYECPSFTFTDIDRITELVAEMNGIPLQLAHQIKQRWDGNLVRAAIQQESGDEIQFPEPRGFQDPEENSVESFLITCRREVEMFLKTPFQIGVYLEEHDVEVDTSFFCPVCRETITDEQQYVQHDPRHPICDECMDNVVRHTRGTLLCPVCRDVIPRPSTTATA